LLRLELLRDASYSITSRGEAATEADPDPWLSSDNRDDDRRTRDALTKPFRT
jgi:hypothetical protein